jgi:hypothetical protein
MVEGFLGLEARFEVPSLCCNGSHCWARQNTTGSWALNFVLGAQLCAGRLGPAVIAIAREPLPALGIHACDIQEATLQGLRKL